MRFKATGRPYKRCRGRFETGKGRKAYRICASASVKAAEAGSGKRIRIRSRRRKGKKKPGAVTARERLLI